MSMYLYYFFMEGSRICSVMSISQKLRAYSSSGDFQHFVHILGQSTIKKQF